MTQRGWLLFAAMGLIWGIPYLLIKVAVGEVTPSTLVLARTAIGSVLLLPIAMQRGALAPLAPRWRWLVAYTAVEVAIPWFLLSDAERHVSSSLAGLLLGAVPIVGAFVAWVTGGDDRPDGRRILGLLVGLAGVATLVGVDVSGDDLPAVAEVALVAICYAVGPVIIARNFTGVPSVGVVAASLALTALVYAPAGIAQLPAAFSAAALASIGILGVVCTALGFIVFFALIAEVGPARSTVITYVNPAVALALGVLLLHEPLTLGIAVGFLLVLAGSFLATRRSRTGAAPQAERGETIAPLIRSRSTNRPD